MSYQVLARKWRPRAFTEMVGQEHVLRALINGLDNDRLHHAYLFTGTRGVGKTTLARIIAKCLNCETGVSSTPCNECSSCREIAEGRFVDLIEVDAASRTKVEDTRELLENVQYAPTRGRYKVYLIDEVHMLSNHSFNALLKTLEEPPPHVKFLLATTDPQKLPVTILSRCLQFNLKNLSPERIVGHLKNVLAEEKIPFEESALWELGRSADGSMRDALSLTDQAIAHGGGTLTLAEVNAMLGTIDRTSVVEICKAVASGDAKAAMARVEHMADHSPDYGSALADMLSIWHQVAIAQTITDALDPMQEHHQDILALAAGVSREDIQLFYQITLMGRKDLPFAADPRSGFEMVLLRLLAFRPVTAEQLQMPDGAPSSSTPLRAIPASGMGAGAGEKKPESKHPSPAGGDAQTVAVREEEPVTGLQSSPTAETTAPAVVISPVPEPLEQMSAESVRGGPAPILEQADTPTVVPASTPAPRLEMVPQLEEEVDEDEYAAFASYESYLSATTDADSGIPASVPDTGPRQNEAPAATIVVESAPGERLLLDDLVPENWHIVCGGLGKVGLLLNTAQNMVLEEADGTSLRFTLDKDNSALYDEEQQSRMAGALADYFGCQVSVEIRIGSVSVETPRRRAERLRAERLQQAIDSLKNDPMVQELARVFGAELVESSVRPID